MSRATISYRIKDLVDSAKVFVSKILTPVICKLIHRDHVEWIVNDSAELGVKVGSRFFFMYKGYSLEYDEGTHDDGSPMLWRPIWRREFGECCHPPSLKTTAGFAKSGEGWKTINGGQIVAVVAAPPKGE